MSRESTRRRGARQRGWSVAALAVAVLVLLLAAGPASAASVTKTFTKSEFITIFDVSPASPYPSSMTVSGIASPVTDVNAVLTNVNHTYLGDIQVALVGPQGQSAYLLYHQGGNGDGNNATVIFDDSSTLFPNPAGFTSGAVYHPYNALSAFNGVDPNGPWRLYVQDDFGGDVGNMAGWGLVITVDDTTAPVTTVDCSPSPNAAGWNNGDVTATLSATDADAGVAGSEYRLSGAPTWTPYSPWLISTEGETTWEYRSTDAVGNVETARSLTVKLDKTQPVTTASGLDGLWHNSPIPVSLSAVDQAGLSGVAGTEYSLDGAASVAGTSLTIDAEGWHNVDYRSSDAAGNTETTQRGSVGYDVTGPVTTDNAPTGWLTGSPAIVTLTPDDGAGCGMSGGLAKTEYRVDGAADWSEGTVVTVAGDGTHTIIYRSSDALGNVGPERSCSLQIDASLPSITVSGAGTAWHARPVMLTFTPSGGSSGVKSVECKLGGGAWTELARTDGAYARTISSQGQTQVQYRTTNVAGVQSTVGSCVVKIDSGKPTLRVASRKLRVWAGSDLRLKLRWNDAVSGRARLDVRVTQYGTQTQTLFKVDLGRRGRWQPVALPWRPDTPGRYRLHLVLSDSAGHRGLASALVVAHP